MVCWRESNRYRQNSRDRAALRREKATVEGAKLFNLKDDIGEQNDLAAKMPEKVAELAALWQKWNAEQVEARWGPPAQKKGE